MTCKDIIKIIENNAPLSLAYPWDNSGFLCGDINKGVKRVYLTLDVNKYTVTEAVSCGADMIISHHPIMFGGIKKINYDDPAGFVLRQLIENNISLYASHTPLDCAKEGINTVLAKKLGLKNTIIIEESASHFGCGLGRIGSLETEITLSMFAERVKSALNAPFVRICGSPQQPIKTAAVGGGACDELIPAAKAMGADVMVTADMKYHIAMDSVESGICIIDPGHYASEHFSIDLFEEMLCGCGLEIFKSSDCDVFSVL